MSLDDSQDLNMRSHEQDELDGVTIFRDLVMELIAHLPVDAVNAELRSLGIDPDAALPDRLVCLISSEFEIRRKSETTVNKAALKQREFSLLRTLHKRVKKQPRVVLADGHILIMDALKSLLEPEFTVVGTFADGLSLVEEAPDLTPDFIILEIGMPGLNGLLAGQRLKQSIPSAKLIYLTMNPDPDIATEAFRLGAAGYLPKIAAASELISALRQIGRGGHYVSPLMTRDMAGAFVQNFKRSKAVPLTVRQKEVLQLLAEGRSMKEVASILGVSPRTAAFHKYRLMEHFQLKKFEEKRLGQLIEDYA